MWESTRPVTVSSVYAKPWAADITLLNETTEGEPTADLLIRSSTLHGTTVEGAIIPTLIDELPMIAVMAAFAEGTTVIRDAQELRVKESDRIQVMTENLQEMGQISKQRKTA